MNVYALLLAAGEGRRFGVQPKLLASLGNGRVLTHSLNKLQALLPQKVVVVLGAHAEQLQPWLGDARWVINRQWPQGMSRSLQTGIAELPADASAVLIALADQPAIGVDEFQQLLDCHQRTGLAVCATFSGVLSVPALIPRRFFSDLQRLSGDKGARQLLIQWQASGELLALPMASAALDVDTPDDLFRLNKPSQTEHQPTGETCEQDNH